MKNRDSGRVYLEAASRSREREFLERVRASSALHGPWVTAPSTPEQFRALVTRCREPRHESLFVCVNETDELAGEFRARVGLDEAAILVNIAAMSALEFKNVTAVAKANLYFDGKVVSHTILLEGGAKKTLGLIYPGEFHFGTDAAERMDIVAGSCRVRLDGSTEWNEYGPGTFFRVPGKSGFDISVSAEIAEYVCSFE